MRYHTLDKELRLVELPPEKLFGIPLDRDEQRWFITCQHGKGDPMVTDPCGFEVSLSAYPYSDLIKTYEIAHNLQRAMEEGDTA
jgi:hypothetical protein